MKKLDFHTHITNETVTPEECAAYFRDMCDRHGLDGIVIHAATYNSAGPHPDCNEKALVISRLLGGAPAFASLHHHRDFVEQTKEYMLQGFKGIKLLEGKPSIWRYYGYTYDAPRFEPFFAYAEEYAIPLLIHNTVCLRILPAFLAQGILMVCFKSIRRLPHQGDCFQRHRLQRKTCTHRPAG